MPDGHRVGGDSLRMRQLTLTKPRYPLKVPYSWLIRGVLRDSFRIVGLTGQFLPIVRVCEFCTLRCKCQSKHTLDRLIVSVRPGPRAARFHAEPTIVSDMAMFRCLQGRKPRTSRSERGFRIRTTRLG